MLRGPCGFRLCESLVNGNSSQALAESRIYRTTKEQKLATVAGEGFFYS